MQNVFFIIVIVIIIKETLLIPFQEKIRNNFRYDRETIFAVENDQSTQWQLEWFIVCKRERKQKKNEWKIVSTVNKKP